SLQDISVGLLSDRFVLDEIITRIEGGDCCIDGARYRAVRDNLRSRSLPCKRLLIGLHEFVGTGQARQGHLLQAAAPKIEPPLAVAVPIFVNELELDLGHSCNSQCMCSPAGRAWAVFASHAEIWASWRSTICRSLWIT